MDSLSSMEPVYSLLIWIFRAFAGFGGHKVTRVGSHHLPKSGGGVLAINHTGYLDFTYASQEVWRTDKRRIRFMAKAELQNYALIKFLMRRCRVIPVDRHAGRESYVEAIKELHAGELVGVYPESTIGRSFELKSFKTGAARMALEADMSIYPLIVWGAQRIVTKGHRNLGRTKTPVAIAVGEPIAAAGTKEELTAALRVAMEKLLHEVQDAYGAHPAGEFWVPKRLGGGAISLEEAEEIDRQVAAERAAQRKAS